MSEITPIAAAGSELDETPSWRVRGAEHRDAEAVASAVAELLTELGATPPPSQAMRQATRALLQDPEGGALFVAESDGELVGLLSASWQSAIHVPGRYGLIQDLWVHSAWRSRAIGGALLAALFERARELGVARVEVGLPRESFAGLEATEAFYRANGFASLGLRMRTLLR
jgi:GNAT superfamily N-acetyltransferase